MTDTILGETMIAGGMTRKKRKRCWKSLMTPWAMLALAGAGVAASSPWWAPPAAIDDNYDTQGYFQRYPYRQSGGLMQMEGDPVVQPRWWSLRTMTEYGYDFRDVQRIGANLHFQTTSRFGFDAEYHWFDDYTKNGQYNGPIQTGDFNLIFRFGQSQHAQWYTGGGINWFDNEERSRAGYNLTYGADVFIGRPFVLSGQLDYGKQADLDFFHARIALGAHWKRLEVFMGYDFMNGGRHELDTVMLGGRIWF